MLGELRLNESPAIELIEGDENQNECRNDAPADLQPMMRVNEGRLAAVAAKFEERIHQYRLSADEGDRHDDQNHHEQVIDVAAETRHILRQPPAVARRNNENG